MNKVIKKNLEGNIKLKVLLLVIVFILIFIFIITSGLATSGKANHLLHEETSSCGMENCHGLDIICGSKVPEACTMLYQLGDFCREFARCEVVEGECRLTSDPRFEACKTCIDTCTNTNTGNLPQQFACEQECRQKFLP
jgi:hypothetical protein